MTAQRPKQQYCDNTVHAAGSGWVGAGYGAAGGAGGLGLHAALRAPDWRGGGVGGWWLVMLVLVLEDIIWRAIQGGVCGWVRQQHARVRGVGGGQGEPQRARYASYGKG